MLHLQGKYAECIIFNDDVEEQAIKQTTEMLNHPAFEGSHIRLMSDIHAGIGCVVGFTGTLTDKVIPNVIGVDIGCGVCAWNLGRQEKIDFAAFDEFIRENIPAGFAKRNKKASPSFLSSLEFLPHINSRRFFKDLEDTCENTGQDFTQVRSSLGTLGGGNHFIELDRCEETGDVWFVVHSGSRNFGLKVCNYHQKIAKSQNPSGSLAYLSGDDALVYFADMAVAQEFGHVNRQIMGFLAARFFKLDSTTLEAVESVHNYIDFNDKMIRKGAISARAGERVIIPWNMRDGIIIGRGKGNPEWNYSAPHGAGRVMGRKHAKETLSLKDFRQTMEGIWSSCVGFDTLDESPMSYKDAQKIEELIRETVVVEYRLKPLYNFKGTD